MYRHEEFLEGLPTISPIVKTPITHTAALTIGATSQSPVLAQANAGWLLPAGGAAWALQGVRSGLQVIRLMGAGKNFAKARAITMVGNELRGGLILADAGTDFWQSQAMVRFAASPHFAGLSPEARLMVSDMEPVTPEIYQMSLRRFKTPSATATGRWGIANAGRHNYTVSGGGTKLDVDGIIGTTVQEAKFISNPASSPFIPGTKIPDFLRAKIVGEVDDEFARMSRIIADPSNPLRNFEVIINNPAAERFFLDMMTKHGLNGRVIIR